MSRVWHNEAWRKIYTRLDAQWLALPFFARAMASDLIKYAREDGTLCAGTDAEDAGSELARIVCARRDEVALVKKMTKVLLDDSYLVLEGGQLRVRNHQPAQERLSPDTLRKRRQRDKERDPSRADSQDGDRDKKRDTPRDKKRDTPPNVTGQVTGHSAGDETRRDESRREKPDARTAAQARGSTYGRADLQRDWERLVGLTAGDSSQLDALVDVLTRMATARRMTPAQLAEHALPSVRPVIAGWGNGSGKAYTPTAGLVADVRRDGRTFAEVLAHADRSRPAPEPPNPELMTAARAQRELDEMAARAVPPPVRWQPPTKAGPGGPA